MGEGGYRRAHSSGSILAFSCLQEGLGKGMGTVVAVGSVAGKIIKGLFGIDQCEGRPVPETRRDKPGAMESF